MEQSAVPSQVGTQTVNQTAVQPDIAQIAQVRHSLIHRGTRERTLRQLPARKPAPLRMVNWSIPVLPKSIGNGRLLIPKNPDRKRFIIRQGSVNGPGLLLFSYGGGSLQQTVNSFFAQIFIQLGQIWDEPGSLINFPTNFIAPGSAVQTYGMNVSVDDIYIYYTGANPISVIAYEGVLA